MASYIDDYMSDYIECNYQIVTSMIAQDDYVRWLLSPHQTIILDYYYVHVCNAVFGYNTNQQGEALMLNFAARWYRKIQRNMYSTQYVVLYKTPLDTVNFPE